MAQQSQIIRFLTTALVAGGMLVTPGIAGAQTRVGPDGTPRRAPARLSGAADAAVSELKSVGFFDRTCLENTTGAAADFTPCLPFFQLMRNGLTAIAPLGSQLSWSWGVPPSERDTVAVPSLRNARGSGWSVISQDQTGNDDLSAADGSLGLHHAGVTTTNDRSCRDHTNAFNPGQPLLAGSDCLDTWGAEGWKGARPIPQDVWAARYNANPATFAFDFWRVTDAELDAAGITPPSATSPGKTLGNFQTYGFSGDHAAQTLCGTTTSRTYGNVIPATSPVVPGGCAGAPTRPGWPLGISTRTDAFTFQLPSLKEIIYYQTIFVNNSQDVYGVGLDYDSLYINFANGWYGGDQRQQQINYHDPSRGAWFISTGPIKPCAVAREVVDLTCTAGAWGAVGVTLGFNFGAAAMIALKSPIGDLRNKWFSRAGTPFYNPTHPLAGDTLTYSHGHLCGFRACARNTYATDPNTTPDHEQRTFGMMSSTEGNTLGARTAASLTPQVYWHTFRNTAFDGLRWAPGQNPALGGGWNTYVPPGNWDYNNDGVPDTLHLDGCHTNGCTAVWGDTLPNGKYGAYSNVASVMGVGPIQLAAGDTVAFVMAVTTAQSDDSAGFEAQVSAAIDNYMNFYLTPDAAPKCRITGVNRTPPAEGLGITVSWDASCMPGQWTDQFLAKQYNDLVAATPGSNPGLVRLRQLNPRLDDTLLFLSTSNIRAFYTFKSCNDGGSWTTGNDCVLGNPDPGSALGFVPFTTFEFDRNPGVVPTDIVDRNILAGRTYTYNVIGETRGANFIVMNGDSVYFNGTDTVCARRCRIENLALAPVLFNSLSASTGNVNVARAYIPLSIQAGGSRSRATVSLASGPMAVARVGVTVTADSLATANYRVSFGDSARATQLEYRTGTNLDSVRTRVVLRMSAALGDSLAINGTNLGGLTANGVAAVVTAPATGVTQRSYTFAAGPVMGLARFTGTPVDALLVTNTLTGNSATPLTFRSNPDYPKFDLSVNSIIANTFDAQRFANADGSAVPPLVEPTVAWQIGTGLSQQDNTTSQNQSNGAYRITWGATPFGSGEPYRLDFSNPSGTAAAINAAIAGRSPVSTGVVTDSAAATIQASTGAPTTFDSLVAVKLPFTVMNTSYNRPVLVAMRRRNTAGKTILVGFGDDTIRVVAPNDAWVPGDTLIFIERQGQNGTGLQRVTFNRAVIGCDQAKFVRLSCNPVYPNTRGAPPLTTYLGAIAGQTNTFAYHTPITAASSFTIAATAPVSGTTLTGQPGAIRTGLAAVRVVPNPFIMLSQYGPNAERGQRLMFTHLPPRGIIRIYTVAGQFVQQITWDESNLTGGGDLTWNMRTREGNVLAAGLYIYVITATDASGGTIASRTSKFVVIR